MGPRCLIDHPICQRNANEVCQNGGECLLTDEYETSKNTFVCICPKGFSGDQCEIDRTKHILSSDKNVDFSSSIFVDFIEIKINNFPIRTTTRKRIRIGQDSIIIYWSLPFHIGFIELLNKNYYLITMQKT
jgi:hypothetical protein